MQVENPIPFSQSSLERKLTTGYLHSRYAGLLLAPFHVREWAWVGPQVGCWSEPCDQPTGLTALPRPLSQLSTHEPTCLSAAALPQLSADWSYACIDYVSSLSDPRNAATLALYLVLLLTGLAAQPWRVLAQWAGRLPVRAALGSHGHSTLH